MDNIDPGTLGIDLCTVSLYSIQNGVLSSLVNKKTNPLWRLKAVSMCQYLP